MSFKITFDPSKRDLALKHRELDFARADEVFAGRTITVLDDRFDYGEARFITALSRGPYGGYRLDGISAFTRVFDALWRREPPHHFNEALSCQGRKVLAGANGLIPTMRRN